jgi:RHS repeat-associated protein
LFHGQFYDYDAGLYYLRARHYNPFTGLFLQRDPLSYADGPNQYAGFGNNPASFRDPDGTLRVPGVRVSVGRLLVGVGKRISKSGPKALRPFAKQARRMGEFVTTGMRARTRLDLKRFEKGFFADSRFSRYWDASEVRAKMDFPENNPRVFQGYERSNERVLLSTRDNFHFDANIDGRGRVGVDVMLKDRDTGLRSIHKELGYGRDNYKRMFAEFGDDLIKGWKGLLVEDNFDAIHKALPPNFTQAHLNSAILNKSVTGKFWKQWARAKNLKPVVKDATYRKGMVDFEVDFVPIKMP